MENASSHAGSARLALLRARSLTRIVQDEIERMILNGELPGGAKVNENAVAEQLSVSRGPVREACRALAELGFVYQVPNRGVFVKRLDQKEALEVYDLRAALMGAAAFMIAPIITAAQLKELQDLLVRMERAAIAGDAPTFHGLNMEFHDAIMDTSGNGRLIRMSQALVKEFQLFRTQRLDHRQALIESNKEHRAIVDALKKRDGRKAFDVSFQHIENGKQRMLKALANLAAVASQPAVQKKKAGSGGAKKTPRARRTA